MNILHLLNIGDISEITYIHTFYIFRFSDCETMLIKQSAVHIYFKLMFHIK